MPATKDNQGKPLTVEELYKNQRNELKLRLVAGKIGIKREISNPLIQKPGLRLTGVSDLQSNRIQVFGLSESKYLTSLSDEDLKGFLQLFQSITFPCIIYTEGTKIPTPLEELAEKKDIPLFRSTLTTALFIDKINKYLEDRLASTITIHGVLVDVLGIGIILQGKSGIGKSECALDLVSKGYRLVADDVVVIKKRAPSTLLGCASEVIKYHMEVRGLGVINIKDLFGITAIREKKEIDIVVELVHWDPGKEYDRLGFTKDSVSLLGIKLPLFKIPVSPGRSIATLIEVAARNHIIEIMGRSPAKDFEKRLNRTISLAKREMR